MLALVYYKTSCTVRSYVCENEDEMWKAIRKVLNKGYIVTEVNVFEPGERTDYTLVFDCNGNPQLKQFDHYKAETV